MTTDMFTPKDRGEILKATAKMLHDSYGVESEKIDNSIVCVIDLGPGMGKTPCVLAPVSQREYPMVRIALNDTAVDINEVQSYLAAQLHDSSTKEPFYYIVPIKGQQPSYVRVGTVEYFPDEMAEAPSVGMKVNYGVFLRPQGNGKPLTKARGGVPVKMIATSGVGFARIKLNPHLEGVLEA